MKKVYIVSAEYAHGEDDVGRGAGDEYFMVLGAFEDKADAKAFLKRERDAKEEYGWGDFYVKSADGSGWSDKGWWLNLDEQELHPKKTKKTKGRAANPEDRRKGERRKKAGYTKGETALAAGVGSALGYGLGSAFGVPAVGSVVGGGVGGYYFSPTRSQKRSRTGGAVGGILGPLGAALGAYIGARKPDKHLKKNPELARKLCALEDKDRRKLVALAEKARDARTRAVMAEIRGEHRAAAKLKAEERKAAESLWQFAERLHLIETGRDVRSNNPSSPPSSSLKRKLMGGGRR